MRTYFVTGGTGVIGSALVPALIDAGDEVYLLVRAADELELRRRVDDLFRFWNLGSAEAKARRKLHALRGDATEPRFALQPAEYSLLQARVTHIVHAAGAVRMNLPLDEARRSAVGSAQKVVDLAWELHGQRRLRKVEFVSTVGVGGRLGVVPEDWIDGARDFHNTYEQSKAEAEQLVRKAVAEGLPLTVHRPSMVVGDSRTGRVIHFQVFYHLCEFLSGRRTLGLYPPLQGQTLDIVPSDHVARVIAVSSRRDDLVGRILHECSGPAGALPLPALRDRVRERMRQQGRRLPPVLTLPAGTFRRALGVAARFLDERSRRAVATLPVFLDYLASNQRFENARTRALLEADDPGSAPPLWQTYLDRVLDGYLASRGGGTE